MSLHPRKFDLTTGSINHHLVRMTIPMIWGILAIISFQLVDAYYISRLGTKELAAFSYTFPVTYGIFSIFIGFGIAMSSVVARLIGEKRTEDVKRVTSHGLLLVLGTSILIACIGIPFLDPLFRLMGADEDSLPAIRDFMITYFLGTFFVSMPVVGNAALRASGDAVLPAIIMTIAAVMNALINPVLIFGLFGFPRLELFGAALGTVFANFCAMVAGLTLMYRKGLYDFSHIRSLVSFSDSAKRLLVIALPAGITSMLPSVVNSVINSLLSKTGPAAVAAFGAASRVEAFTLVILMALSIGMAPIIGQNWGAKNMDRVRQTIRSGLIFCFVWSAAMAVILLTFATPLAEVFSKESNVITYLSLYFMTVPISYAFSNLTNGWGSAFNAIGKPQFSAGMLFIKMIVLTIPAVTVGYYLNGVTGIFISLLIVNAVAGIGFHFWCTTKFKANMDLALISPK